MIGLGTIKEETDVNEKPKMNKMLTAKILA